MTYDCFIVLTTARHAQDETTKPYLLAKAVSGHWVDPPGYVVVNTVGEYQELMDMVNAEAANIAAFYLWDWRQGLVDVDHELAGQHNEILALMKPHPVLDVNGDVVGTTPATFANPNWGHVWQGGKVDRRFARSVSLGFSRGFN